MSNRPVVLYVDEARKDELTANLIRARPQIRKAVKKACGILNKLTPDGAIYASGWVLADLIVSLMDDEEQAAELLKTVHRQVEREFTTAYTDDDAAPAALN